MNAATYKLTNGDLADMDAGELREHATAYAASNFRDDYVAALVQRIADLTGIDQDEICEDIGPWRNK